MSAMDWIVFGFCWAIPVILWMLKLYREGRR
jgi:hypothetical protein